MHEIGLAAAISEWIEAPLGNRHDLKVEFIDHVDDKNRKSLDENTHALLFRNVRELITNVIKHARANHIRVHLTEKAGEVQIVVEDNGVEIDLETANTQKKQNSGFGLFSIQERMSDLGGSFEIRSRPGEGYRVILKVPVKPEATNA